MFIYDIFKIGIYRKIYGVSLVLSVKLGDEPFTLLEGYHSTFFFDNTTLLDIYQLFISHVKFSDFDRLVYLKKMEWRNYRW